MQKVNVAEIDEVAWQIGDGAYRGFGIDVSEELGRDPDSLDLSERHPLDVEIQRIPPGYGSFPLHAHSAQWEMYIVISGSGFVREEFDSTVVTGIRFSD